MKLASGVVFEEIEEQGILIHLSDDEVFKLNSTGAFVLKAVHQQIPTQEIATRMTEVFQIDFDVAENDVQHFLKFLLERGLVEEGSG